MPNPGISPRTANTAQTAAAKMAIARAAAAEMLAVAAAKATAAKSPTAGSIAKSAPAKAPTVTTEATPPKPATRLCRAGDCQQDSSHQANRKHRGLSYRKCIHWTLKPRSNYCFGAGATEGLDNSGFRNGSLMAPAGISA